MNMRALVARPTACLPQLSRGCIARLADWPCVVRMVSRLDDERYYYLNLPKLYEAGRGHAERAQARTVESARSG